MSSIVVVESSSLDFTKFILIISDNASTDKTRQICEEYAEKDKRVQYFRNEVNIGVANNYTKVVELAEGSDYFMWMAHDDLWDKTFLSKTLNVLENNPNASLCSVNSNVINSRGKKICKVYCAGP